MKKSKLLLPIYLIVSLVIIIAAVIVSLTAGINLGIDFAGGKQIEIKLDETTNTSGYPEKINAALKDYNLVIDSSFQEDKYTDTYYVVKINHQKAMTDETKNDIRAAIANKLGINTENVGEVVEISGNVTEQTLINISIAIVAIFVLVFVACWIRYVNTVWQKYFPISIRYVFLKVTHSLRLISTKFYLKAKGDTMRYASGICCQNAARMRTTL